VGELLVGLAVVALVVHPVWWLAGGRRALGSGWWVVSGVGWFVVAFSQDVAWVGWGCLAAAVLCLWEGWVRLPSDPAV
jgi:hypothetical protein